MEADTDGAERLTRARVDESLPPRVVDLSLSMSGNWFVLRFSHVEKGNAYWLCRCTCGVERPVSGANIQRKRSKSCGSCKRSAAKRDAVVEARRSGMPMREIMKKFDVPKSTFWRFCKGVKRGPKPKASAT